MKVPKIAGAPVDSLIANLSSPERWTVEASKRELIERGASVLPAVKKWGLSLSGADAERFKPIFDEVLAEPLFFSLVSAFEVDTLLYFFLVSSTAFLRTAEATFAAILAP